MRLSDEVLLTWLCAIRLNSCEDFDVAVPRRVYRQLQARGWASIRRDEDDPRDMVVTITEAGHAASDVFAPEAGCVSLEELQLTAPRRGEGK